MDQNRKSELLKKFSERTLSASEEKEFWEMAANGDHLSLLEDEDDDQIILNTIDAPDDIEHSLHSIKENLSSKIVFSRKKPAKLIFRVAASIAAVMLLIAGVKGIQQYNFIQDTKTFIIVEAALGKTEKVILPDSSVVSVSSGSIFRYPKAFGNNERRVYLQNGDAFFEVTKDPKKPFSVESGELQTTALGTSFIVAYNAVYRYSKVDLYTGKVAIRQIDKRNTHAAIYLMPGDAYEYVGGKETFSNFKVEDVNPIEKGLVFEHSSFSEAIYKIASWHKINIVFDQINTRNFTVNGDFNGKQLNEILTSIAFIHKLKFIKTDSLTYTFMKK